MGASAARLEVVAGNAAGMSILVSDELVIGRHADGAGRLADDEEISRSHARVAVDGSGFCAIEDLGSTNGTFVNGLRISAPHTLSPGDTVELGATTLVVRELPRTDPAETVGVPAAGGPEPNAAADQATVVPGAQTPASVSENAPAASLAENGSVPPAPLRLRLEVDFVGREAMLSLDEASDTVRLKFEEGVWRFSTFSPIDKGDPA